MIKIDISKLPIPKIHLINKKEKYLDSFYDKKFLTKYFNEK